ncbi:hypothetical protein B0T24DRAFT_525230 [Lasiosphaeria ovina]|uniref:Uncharacterized protein n=1 Tax=Lasiosphaeria ovina TaxID=92902 RepID=A0AAE0KHV6_9PEZI|nr:hypothetical protein B0T24DRAFT_525230 [Lasiosphaeria ovina]
MDPAGSKRRWISQLRETFPLTGVDLIAPKVMARGVYGFPFPDPAEIEPAVSYLRQRFHLALQRWPFLAGQVVQDEGDQHFKLVFSHDPANFSINRFPDEVFDFQVLGTSDFAWTYDELSMNRVPPSALTRDVFSLEPHNPAVGRPNYPAALRVSFIDGGLLLCFSLDHRVVDGVSIVQFVTFFSSAETAGFDAAYFNDLLQRRNAINTIQNGTAAADLTRLPNLDVAPATPAAPPNANLSSVARILAFSAATVDSLHARALQHVKLSHGTSSFLSKPDVLGALVWQHVLRARRPRLQPDETARFASACDLRTRSADPSITGPPAYFGNMFVRSTASGAVRDLAPAAEARRPVTLQRVAETAWLVRRGVATLRHPHDVAAAVRLCGVAGSSSISNAFTYDLDKGRTGLSNSITTRMGADVMFAHVPGVRPGPPGWVRKTYSATEGSMNILPRRGGAAGAADWEVSVALRVDDMDRICAAQELGQYLL